MAGSASVRTGESRRLGAARQPDGDAFGELVQAHRHELLAHCYRMLGSVHDAEDVVQDSLLRAWRALPRFTGDPRLLRPWLYKIATNACLNALAGRPKRTLPMDHGRPADPAGGPGAPVTAPVWVEPYPDELSGLQDVSTAPHARYEQREAVELAFIAALQRLPPRQRAVLILRDVLGFSAREAAGVLDTTVASANSALQRARKTLEQRRPERSQQTTLRCLGDKSVRQLVERFTDAFECGNVDAILGLLTDDAVFAMPPHAVWYRGHRALAGSWLMPNQVPTGLRYVPTRANGQLAFTVYRLDPQTGDGVPIALDVLTVRDARIAAIVAFRAPDMLQMFRLPSGTRPGRAPFAAARNAAS